MNSPAFTAIHQVVPNVPAQVGVIDAMQKLIRVADVSNVMYYVPNHVIVVSSAVLVVDDSGTIDASRVVKSEIVHMVTNNAHVGGVVNDAVTGISSTPGDVKALNVDVVRKIGPNDVNTGSANHRAPLRVGEEAN